MTAGAVTRLPAPVTSLAPRLPDSTDLPLSWSQERLWFLHQLDPNGAAYHIVLARRIRGALDTDLLGRALTNVVVRHESLRSRFPSPDGTPTQVVVPATTMTPDHVDLTDLPPDQRGAAARELLIERLEMPFDLAAGPLLRTVLVRLGTTEHVLGLVAHHIVADGWSLDLLCTELAGWYRAARHGEDLVVAPLPVQYPDYALWQRTRPDGPDLERQIAYWTRQLAGVPAVDLCGGRPRPPVRGSRGAVLRAHLPGRLCARVSGLARSHRMTMFMTVLTAYQAVLAKHSGLDDICVGTPVSVRDQVQLEPLIGLFVNTLAIRGDLSGDPSFRELLARTRSTALDAYTNVELPFDRLVNELDVARDLSRTPVFQTMFRLDQGAGAQLSLDGLEVSPFELDYRAAQVDLMLEVAWIESGGWADFVYDRDLFEPAQIRALADDLVELLAAACADPDQRLSDAGVLAATPRRRQPVPAVAEAATVPAPPEGSPEPRGVVEIALAELWAQALGLARVGATDDFFALGGHSLLAAKVVARYRTMRPPGTRPISVMDLFRYRTVRRLARLVDGTGPAAQADGLLHELTPPPLAGPARMTLVCVPYGGASAVVYQPLADALGPDSSLFAVAIPGHDPGRREQPLPLAQVASACVAEIQHRITGPVVLYGHCGVGGALTVEIARQLQASGREPDAVYLGATFPFARPRGRLMRWLSIRESMRGDQVTANWLTSMGADLDGLDAEQMRFIVRNIRHDGRAAEAYYSNLNAGLHNSTSGDVAGLHVDPARAGLRCPVISVVGERDPVTEFATERYLEWQFLADRTALVVLPRAGHFFLKYRAGELAEIVTGTHRALAGGTLRPSPVAPTGTRGRWWVAGVSPHAGLSRHGGVSPEAVAPAAGPDVRPSMARFLVIALGQLMSLVGSAVTEFAIPLWAYLRTGSLAQYTILATLAIVPGVLIAPLAGAVVDRAPRRLVMLAADAMSAAAVGTVAVLYATGAPELNALYPLVAWLSMALTFQRLAYLSAVPQLVPKRYLGHVNGVVEMFTGVAQFAAPLVAVALVSTVGLGGVLAFDAMSYLVAIVVVLAVRFPSTLPQRRREPIGVEILGGLRYSLDRPEFRAMLGYFAVQTLFLSALLVTISPLVLSFAPVSATGPVAVLGSLGAALGGLAMVVWGGPSRRRMRAVLLGTVVQGGFGMLVGLRPSLVLVTIGLAGMLFCLAIVRGSYATIVQVKVPQRLHGRVFAVNQILSWSTIPLGFAVLVPLWTRAFEPMLAPDGQLASTVGSVIGVGPGRGMGLMYLVFGAVMLVTSLVALRYGRLSRFDAEVPDADADDLVGLREHQSANGAPDSAQTSQEVSR